MSTLSDTYRQISSIVSDLDNEHFCLNERMNRLKELEMEMASISNEISNIEKSIDSQLSKAKILASKANIPFDYAPPEKEEWDSSDWNSSSQYC